jgi:colicin import membrane protein
MSTAIVEVQTAVAEFDRVAAGIAELKQSYGGVVYDVAIADGMKAAKDARAAIREPRYEIERVRTKAKAPILKLGKELDTRAKQITDDLLAIENPIDQQIKNEEARKEREKQARAEAEQRRVQAHLDRITYLNGSPNLSSLDDPALIAEHISDLESEVVDESMEEYRERADAAKATGIARLQALHAASVERVAEAARIKAEREELAKLRAEQAERDRLERERIAEEERQAKAVRDAEAAKQATELKLAREKQEAEAAEQRAAQAKAQAVIDAENARIANANKEAALKLAADRAEFEHAQAVERKAKADEAERQAEQARIAAIKRPDDAEIVQALCDRFKAPRRKVLAWILSLDFSKFEKAEV